MVVYVASFLLPMVNNFSTHSNEACERVIALLWMQCGFTHHGILIPVTRSIPTPGVIEVQLSSHAMYFTPVHVRSVMRNMTKMYELLMGPMYDW